jgi:DNA-binding NarL/FixJ family response regulator
MRFSSFREILTTSVPRAEGVAGKAGSRPAYMLYGRDAERAAIGELLEAARASRSGVLVLRGEPGVGKTALLEDTRDRASDMHILSARGVESETELPFAGLHQLIRPALHLLQRLPEPQAGALQGALGLTVRSGDERFLISAACLSLLSELAERRPVLCLIDDGQWLDTPSADALLFVARRLDAEGIVMLVAARETDAGSFDARELPHLEIGGLDSESASCLLSRGVGGIAPSVRDLLVEQAGGNALALVELPAALTAAQLTGEEPLPATLPLTGELERLCLERVRRLPEPTQRLLLVVAADNSGRLAPVMRAAEALGIGAEALAPAEQGGVVSVTGTNIDMRHPLVRSAVYQGSSSSERRAAHLALAGALTDDVEEDERAWHRAAAAFGPDVAVADELESTAERARLRSGHAAAAAALDRAAQLSVDDESKARRLVDAARSAWDAGQPERALLQLERADPIVTDPRVRAKLDHVRGEIQFRCGVLLEAYQTLIAGAARAAPLDTRKALEMLFDAANAAVTAGDYAAVTEAGRRAAALPRRSEQERLLIGLLIGVAGLQGAESPSELPRILDAIAHADEFDEPRWLIWASGGAQIVGDQARAAELLRRAVALARASAQRERLTPALASFVLDGMIQGRFAVAAEAEEGLKLARDAGLRNLTSIFLATRAWFAAVGGQIEQCRAYAADVTEQARATGAALATAIVEWGLSLVDLSGGRPREAIARLESIRVATSGVGHPYIALLSTPDLVEGSVRTGRHQRARSAFAALERFAQPGAPTWALALAARCRALLSQSQEAEHEFELALSLHTEGSRPFDHSRTALLFGEFLRRHRRRKDAREQLRFALAGFERLGAEAWAERARTELRASGETARKRNPSTIDQLTPQELQIARFVAEGQSNKEVAAQLFLSPRTIDYHLRNVFAKLGIKSRTQLARFPFGEEEADAQEHAAALA